jgi:hypothetical protein
MTLKGTLTVLATIIVIFAIVFFVADDNMATGSFSTEGVLVSSFKTAQSGRMAADETRHYIFKLANGKEAVISGRLFWDTKDEDYPKDIRVKVFYRKGHFTNRLIYDYFEPLDQPATDMKPILDQSESLSGSQR